MGLQRGDLCVTPCGGRGRESEAAPAKLRPRPWIPAFGDLCTTVHNRQSRTLRTHPQHTLPPQGPSAPATWNPGEARPITPPTPLQPCHPPLALAPRRLYTSPMRNPTSAYPGLPDPARGISQRSRNCPESGPPYPQNGSCWTKRIVSAAGGFEADSFPKIEKLEQKLGVQSNRRSSARPEGPSPRRETFAQPRHSRAGGNPATPSFPRKRESRVGRRRGAPPPHHSPRPNPPPTRPSRQRPGIQGGAPGSRGLLHPPNLALHGELRKRLPSRE